ncbi:heterokaryon incompatibility protein-domain-containing protein [Echria macrotheca]|uniref:Heterokaryon incompatibility protein-domain-containing protein n=1 Tax=Echria macrotheca TaxID=438768 RepID=A0AAJ0BND4_9PEZI|nr:heterokaryon incompatibility protein-domain-containing protein [Echria macrotheca]
MSLSSRSPHTPLDESRREIRLLSIKTDSPEKQIECELHITRLEPEDDRPLPFTALSYVWGPPNFTEAIVLNGEEFLITPALHAALRYVRKHWRDAFPGRDEAEFRLWADGICINQRDQQERSSQVQLMSTLFASAELVIGWLGAENPLRMALSLSSVLFLSKGFARMGFRHGHRGDIQFALRDFEWITAGPYASPLLWDSVAYFFDSPYWTRIWIFQETVLARKLLVVCPLAALDFSVLPAFFSAIQALDGIDPDPNWTKEAREAWSRRVRVLSAEGYAAIASGICLAQEDDDTKAYLMSPEGKKRRLWDLGEIAFALNASDPKDFVYGLTGLLGVKIIPDYNPMVPSWVAWMDYVKAWVSLPEWDVPWWEVLGEFGSVTKYCHLSFLLLSGRGLFEYPDDCPSWVPHFVGMSESRRARTAFTVPSIQQLLPADTGMRGLGDFSPHRILGNTLITRGLVVQRISRTFPLPPVGVGDWETEEEDTLARGERKTRLLDFIVNFTSRYPRYVTGITALNAVVSVLSADFTPSMSILVFRNRVTLLMEIMEACCIHHMNTHHGLPYDLWSIVRSKFGLHYLAELPGWLVSNFWTVSDMQREGLNEQALIYFVEGSSWFKGTESQWWANTEHTFVRDIGLSIPFETEDGYVGVCPHGSQVGDLVCVLYGGVVPFVLRPVGDGNYINVGWCTLLGFMTGEAAQTMLPGDGTSDLQVFNIF